MNKKMRTANTGRGFAAASLAALALCLCGAPEVRAQWTQPTPSDNTISTANSVGVGTTAPTRRLDLVSDVSGVSFEAGSGTPNSGAIRFGDSTGWKFNIGRSRNSVSGALNSGSAGLLMTIQDNGNVGLGTSSPSSRLHLVSGTTSATALLRLDTGAPAGGTAVSVGASGGDSTFDLSVNRAGQYYSRLGVSASGDLFLQPNAGGKVGIGVTTPQAALDIAGAGGVLFRTDISSLGFSAFDRPSAPGNQLVFQGNAGAYSVFNVTTKNGNVGAEKAGAIAMWTVDIANAANATQFQLQHSPAYGGVVFTQKFGTGAMGDRKISLQAGWDGAAAPTQLVLGANGSVGVGTSAPTNLNGVKLEVSGGVKVSGAVMAGSIQSTYQDVAEWAPSTQKLQAGTVVVLDTERTNHVLASSESYDTKVAGVISAKPGITLGQDGEGKVLVATTGRVKVKVDATREPIKVGDLLVTSDTEGVAMKSIPVEVGGAQIHRPGTIIGKALEPLAGGTGEILVLLSLQ